MKLLITGAWKYTEEQLQNIRKLGNEIVEMPDERGELPCDDFEGVICNGLFLYHDIDKFKKLRYIQLTSAGFDRVPMDYIKAKGIKIYNAKGVYSIPMAEFAIGKVLEIYKGSYGFWENQKKHIWGKNRNLRELYGKIVCVIGCGSVGTECGKRFKAFGCRVIGVDIEKRDWFDGIIDLEEGLKTADVVILTLPLTNETEYIINSENVKLLKSGCVLVNIARGAIIDANALLIRRDIYILLDVFENEPLRKDSPLWYMENIIITPHNSYVSDRNIERLGNVIMENLKR